MSIQTSRLRQERLIPTIKKTVSMFVGMLPMLVGVVLLTGLILELLPTEKAAAWFGRNNLLNALTGAALGSISAGHPLTSYILGGEFLANGVNLVAVTALLVSWVTVGIRFSRTPHIQFEVIRSELH